MPIKQQRLLALGMLVLLSGSGCSSLWEPFLENRQQPPADQSPPDDLGGDCPAVPGNLASNPSFESSLTGGGPDGEANNTGKPPSTIAGPWLGCCPQRTDGGTQWSVTQEVGHCGARSLAVKSTMAAANFLFQPISDQSASAGKTFRLSGFVHVIQTGNPGQISCEVWDGATLKTIASTEVLTAPTSGWLAVMQSGTVPYGGRLQVRISSSGDVQAYVDDLVLVIP
jgi:hypothetical protein